MIIGLFGPQGGGKSLLEVLLGRWLVPQGATLYANMAIDGATQISSLAEIPHDQKPKVLLLDEAMLFLDSRLFSSSNTQQFTQFLLFIRKWNIAFIYTTNAPHQVDKRLRDLTHYMILCRRSGGWFEYLIVDPLSMAVHRHMLPARSEVFALANYNTYAAPTMIDMAGALGDLGKYVAGRSGK